MRELYDGGFAGIGALVHKLQSDYGEHLNTKWKDVALRKVLEKELEIQFELDMLGPAKGSSDEKNDNNERLQRLTKEVQSRLSGRNMDSFWNYFTKMARFYSPRLCEIF